MHRNPSLVREGARPSYRFDYTAFYLRDERSSPEFGRGAAVPSLQEQRDPTAMASTAMRATPTNPNHRERRP